MHVTRLSQAPEYEAPNHFDMQCLRLQGREAGPAVQMWMGLSILQPGGHTSLAGSPVEKQYFVVAGEVTVVSELQGVETRAVLQLHDSCRMAPGEKRQIINHTHHEARILLVMPFDPPAA
jgi:hypothetical protein